MQQRVEAVKEIIHKWAELCDDPVELTLEYAELSDELKAVLACRMREVTRGYDPYEE